MGTHSCTIYMFCCGWGPNFIASGNLENPNFSWENVGQSMRDALNAYHPLPQAPRCHRRHGEACCPGEPCSALPGLGENGMSTGKSRDFKQQKWIKNGISTSNDKYFKWPKWSLKQKVRFEPSQLYERDCNAGLALIRIGNIRFSVHLPLKIWKLSNHHADGTIKTGDVLNKTCKAANNLMMTIEARGKNWWPMTLSNSWIKNTMATWAPMFAQ